MSILTHGIQRDFPESNIAKWGCYWLTLCKYAELKGGRTLVNKDQVLKYYRHCVDKGWIQANCFVLNPIAVLNGLGLGARGVTNSTVSGHPLPVIKAGRHPQWGLHFWLELEGGNVWDSMGFKFHDAHVFNSYRVFV